MVNDLKSFNFWCHKVLPSVYDESLSYYEVLGKLIEYCDKLVNNQNDMNTMLEKYGVDILTLQKDTNYLKSEIDKVKNGSYTSMYLKSLSNWIDNNLELIVSRIVKFISFGLNDDGYFIANIPQTWEFIEFDTDVNTNSNTYGCLILKW